MRATGTSARSRDAIEPTYRYTTVLNGFSARLTGEQAAALATHPSVLSVTPDVLYEVATHHSPEVLGLTGRHGLWAQLGGTGPRHGAGDGIVIGVVDSGIWPENPSFDDTGYPAPPRDWNGECETGEEWTEDLCDNKIIGARWYVDGYGVENTLPEDYLSPRDGTGHGTHVASTAAGNAYVDATTRTMSAEISGVAPAARIAVYKACWRTPSGEGYCAASDVAAAVDDAVADGVDVLNLSILGTPDNFLDPMEQAFLHASDAGVFVTVVAGNSGPSAGAVHHPSPWVTTVAASTHVVYESTVELGDGQRFIGASLTAPLPNHTPVVLGRDIPAAGVDPADAALCLPGSLDPARAQGRIVVCDRGSDPRLQKSAVVRDAGGVGMILLNVTEGTLIHDNHFVPTVHLSHEYRDEIYAYITGTQNPTAAILDDHTGSSTQVPEIADFSSPGPTAGAGGDLLKPDISAPGVYVLAAVAPPAHQGENFNYWSGTSMAAPHIAGLAALFRERYPTWSPAAIKSAMMTTAFDHRSTNNPLLQGAGHVNPRRFFNPGLVFDAGPEDYRAFLNGQGIPADPNLEPIEAFNLNLPSVSIGQLVGRQTVTRTVTAVADGWHRYTPRVEGMPGVRVTVSPRSIALRRGQQATFTITFERTSAAFGEWSTGYLIWTSGRGRDAITVRQPLTVRPAAVSVPAEVSGEGASGSVEMTVTGGFIGEVAVTTAGVVPGVEDSGTLTPGPLALTNDASNRLYTFSVPEGVTLLRGELDAANDSDDMDLYLFLHIDIGTEDGLIVLLDSGVTSAADERVEIFSPPPGEYMLLVHSRSTESSSSDFTLTRFLVGEDAGNLTVSPNPIPVTYRQEATVTVSWSGLDPTVPYLGWIGYENTARRTIVSIN